MPTRYCIQPTACLGGEFKLCARVGFTSSAKDGMSKLSWVLFFACSDNNWVPTGCLGTCAVCKLVLEHQRSRAIVLKSSSSIKPPMKLSFQDFIPVDTPFDIANS
jgi:hypothetical protein